MEDPSPAPRDPVDQIREARRQAMILLFKEQKLAEQLRAMEPRVSGLMLSYENHQRQLNILAVSHACVALAVFLLAVIGGHNHTTTVMALVYPVLFAAFGLALVVVGAQTAHVWMVRAFALAFFAFGLWSAAGVLYAVYNDMQMRRWYDWALLSLQALDLALTIGYLWTAEQVAGIGGTISGEFADAHTKRILVTPHTAHLGDEAAINARVMRPSLAARIAAAISSVSRLTEPRVHTD